MSEEEAKPQQQQAPQQQAPQQQQPQQRPPRPPRENRGGPPSGPGGGRPERSAGGPSGDRPRGGGGDNRGGGGGPRTDNRGPDNRGNDNRGADNRSGDRGGGFDRDRRGNFDAFAMDIDYDKLLSDPLYLDNQAHVVVARMRDMDTATRSQLRRLYSAVRRAVRAPESERQHGFVMLRARLAYTIARHSLRSLDTLEKLLLQVTRKNELRGYERFRDLFEAIIAYNE